MIDTVKFGVTTWDEVEIKSGNAFQGGKKDVFMKLENGSNVVRCVTRPHQYHVHVFKEEGDSGFGDKIMCSMPGHGSCPLCEKGDRPKRRWYLGVIDRKEGRYKILDISVSVFKAIQELSRDEDYGDPMKYDIDIKVDKKGGATGYYTVIPKPPKPLTAADIEIKNAVNTEDLQRKCTPISPEKVLERIAAARARKGKGPMVKSAAPSVVTVDMTGDHEDLTFPMVAE